MIEETLAQPAPSTNASIIINNNPGEQNKAKMIKAFGHFANNCYYILSHINKF